MREKVDQYYSEYTRCLRSEMFDKVLNALMLNSTQGTQFKGNHD